MKKFNVFILGVFVGGIIGIVIHAWVTGTLWA